MLISLIIAANLTNSVYAQDAVVLEKDQKAPFTGILITHKMAQDAKNTAIERDGLMEINESYKRSETHYKAINDAQERKVELLLNQNDKLALRLQDERSMGTWERIGWLSLGIIATGVAFYGYGKGKTGN